LRGALDDRRVRRGDRAPLGSGSSPRVPRDRFACFLSRSPRAPRLATITDHWRRATSAAGAERPFGAGQETRPTRPTARAAPGLLDGRLVVRQSSGAGPPVPRGSRVGTDGVTQARRRERRPAARQDGEYVRGEPTPDQSRDENRPREPADESVGEMMIEQHERGDPAVHAAADVERLLASAPALGRIVDLAREQAPEGAARAGERSGPTGGSAGPGRGPAAD